MSLKKSDHLYLVDGSGYIFRAFHALPPLTRKSDKLPIGAVAGFCNMLVRLMDDMAAEESPTHLAVIFDASGKTFRNDIYPDYKANRDAPPEDLIPQFPLVREAVKAFGIPSIELQGYEADDLIAAYTHAATRSGARVSIVSSDKDLMQLVTDRVNMIDTMKDRKIGPAEVLEKFEVGPERVIDVQSLAGDSVDNVPGVPGIGIKTAALLINEYGDLETLLERAGEIKQNKRRENLIEFAEQARISRELVTLRTDTPLPVDMSEMGLTPPEAGMLMGFLKAMEFNTLTRRVSKRYDINADDYEASSDLAAKPTAISSSGATEKASSDLPPAMTDLPPIDSSAYECVTDMAVLDNWIEDIIATGYVAIDTETDGLDAVSCRLVGISLATRPGHACYIPLAHGIGEGLALADDVPSQLAEADVLVRLKPLLQDASIMKILQNAKFDLQVLGQRKIEVHPVEDTMLMSYALAAGQRGHGMDELSELYLGHKPISIKELLGTGKSQITFDQVPLEKATPYAAEDADITLRLWQMMRPELVKDRVVSVYQTTEKPLVPVIVDMEKNGICVDRNVLSRLSGEFAQKMAAMEEDIYKLAGETFNIASPKQLGDILFDKMGLPGGKKTKTGAWGTGADVLEGLAAEGHDLAAQVLEWRGLAKLKSTYTDALPEFINPETGRIHTSYSLASTTTGRLASSDPNLQNIPIRTEDGRRIRTAFVAEKGNLLVSADYSQIELRLLAHIADIDSLRQAFADGQDIHAMTASEMFGVPLADMTAETRRRAKAINFGIIYGISAFGLANQLGISRGEASDYIKAYFEKFPGIKDYMEAVKQEAHAQGYVSTLFGRRIYLREIISKIPARRAFAERAAINAPIQGSAADIIRRAMIAMPPVLKKKLPKSRMLLQVHDELIFEAPESETDKLMQNVREVMQNACAPRLSLSVPLVVEAQAAKNWDEAH
ncbi:membrane lipoprotein [Candidatus Micropelagos thuwalensis]|uniref:DNA polymerase I n=1 Tax=Candidatus Micropelagius thuwalensis TaxID=1397666 RepID=U2XNP6_9PROT|nr:DNA polymerase I [Candidatus Micropelagos thuwalensis]ERL46737.1 membrane lipoprotein [Candidatus Micropelagos thuwalensis]